MIQRPRHHSSATQYAFLRVLALVAMVFQVLVTADHLGASAVRAFGAAPADAGFGIMEICTGDGVEIVVIGDSTGSAGHDCPICLSAAVADFGETAPLNVPDLALGPVAFTQAFRQEADKHGIRVSTAKPIRAPPSVLI